MHILGLIHDIFHGKIFDCKDYQDRIKFSFNSNAQMCQITLKSVNMEDAGIWICVLETKYKNVFVDSLQKVYGKIILSVKKSPKILEKFQSTSVITTDLDTETNILTDSKIQNISIVDGVNVTKSPMILENFQSISVML